MEFLVNQKSASDSMKKIELEKRLQYHVERNIYGYRCPSETIAMHLANLPDYELFTLLADQYLFSEKVKEIGNIVDWHQRMLL